ncbi:MAG: orotidine 5'-phosphate decarboxylase / HUMPS family protein [Anaerolineales bacterium]|nr:orotidine 5'-phosphate decarboxylase / HUMPS family protein [Anaerolineales bacterium]MDP2777655.1 orotidine 5'-phosphate decarboxylase / HUMPS family protein [Anaerolineales bacterium]
MINLQLAMDTLDGDEALKLAASVAPYADILEAGTPLIKSVGINIVRKLKSAHPEKIVLADLKSSDVGAYEANMAFTAGADIVTTQGITTLATICEVQREADKWKRRAEVDMTGVKDPIARAKEVQAVGVSLVLFHRSIDEELTQGALWDEKAVNIVLEMCNLGLDVVIAGGINYDILTLLRGVPIYGIVIGRGITAQPDPAQAAEKITHRIRQIWPA